MIIPGSDNLALRCSRSRCSNGPKWEINWQNPRIHTDGRWKTWLACEEHVDYLKEFVAQRGFPVSTVHLRSTKF